MKNGDTSEPEAGSDPSVEATPMPLVHLAYASVAARGFALPQITAMLREIRPKNRRAGITGMLLFSEGDFFQVIEGPQDVVDRLFLRISGDRRHSQVMKLIEEPIAERAFGDWTMGCTELSRKELRSIEGCNDFFAGGACFRDLGSGRARTLLGAFRDGRWRRAA